MNRQYKYLATFTAPTIKAKHLVCDIEATGLNPRKDSIVGIAFAADDITGYYTPDVQGFMTALRNSNCSLIFHNAVYDCSMLAAKGYGATLSKHELHDTMLLAHTIDPDRKSLGLKDLSRQYLGEESTKWDAAMKAWLEQNGLDKGSLSQAPKDLLTKYACEDAINTFGLFKSLCAKIRQMQEYFKHHQIDCDIWDYYRKDYCDLIPVVTRMQLGGVKLDLEATAKKQQELQERTQAIAQELTQLNKAAVETVEEYLHKKKIEQRLKTNVSGKLKKTPPRVPFNWDSNDHLKYLFIDCYKEKATKKTQKGKVSIDNTVIESFMPRYPWVEKLLEYKALKKLTSTYLSSLLEKQEGGFIYANFNLAGTATGRFSSSNPNLQNLPKQGGIKSLFVPRPGHKFIYADYSQLELRVAAHLSQDPLLVGEYNKQKPDLHQITASFLKIPRDKGKTINFAIIYKASGWRLAEIMGWMDGIPLCTKPEGRCDWKEPDTMCLGCVQRKRAAKKGDALVENLFGKYKGIKKYVDKQQDFMLRYRIATSQFGKIRRLPQLASAVRREYNHALKAGFNLPIQSFGASLCKRSMVKLHKAGYRIVNQIHDSIIVEVPNELVEADMQFVKKIMENVCELRVPLVVEPKILTSFEEKHE